MLDILLKQPSAARFLVGKMYRLLISEAQPPPARIIEPLAAGYQQREFDTAWLVETMLASNLFFSPHAVRQRIKSPVEFAVGLLRPLRGTANMYAVAEDLRSLGQGVFYPPNVKGWDGGQEWINSASLLARANLAWGLVSSTDSRLKCRVPLEELARQAAADAFGRPRLIRDWLT